jgi:hypothetical protein
MANRTRKEQNIEGVAGIIYEARVAGPVPDLLNMEEILASNAAGWDIDVRYDDGDYFDDKSFTNVTDLILDEDDLRAAIVMAERWEIENR